ncbi:MAG: PP2C family serine/threonine-protein phosphatase [Methanoregula sp.]|nr:PP2C family serine/threonine-protein phosphatase [Methanoregula sp.]
MTWKFSFSSVTGRSHADRGESGQDYSRAGSIRIADNEFFIGLAADGAGSTTDGGRGAEIACGTMYGCIIETLRQDSDLSRVTDAQVRDWITTSRDAIAGEADLKGKRLKDYACTLLGAVTGQDRAIFFQLGDGAIVIGGEGDYETVFWPEQGEYANTTFFVSDETYLERLKCLHHTGSPGEIALFTDGLQNLALSFAQKKAHAGFFRPLFEALRKNPGNEFSGFSNHLKSFLSRNDVSARSDDDKTLVLAVQG